MTTQRVVIGQKRKPVPIIVEQEVAATQYPVVNLSFLVQMIPSDWREALQSLFLKPYFIELEQRVQQFVNLAKTTQQTMCPSVKNIFKMFQLCPFEKVKVVILGNDPYLYKNQATGLAFAVSPLTKTPPVLENILEECKREYDGDFVCSTDLEHWARQGVLLLNNVLTTTEKQMGSHESWGWQQFTDDVLQIVSNTKRVMVFMAWGSYAKGKLSSLQKQPGQYRLTASHPSPKTAEDGFFGCNHFMECNEMLLKHSLPAIQWGTKKDGSSLDPPKAVQFSITKFARVSSISK